MNARSTDFTTASFEGLELGGLTQPRAIQAKPNGAGHTRDLLKVRKAQRSRHRPDHHTVISAKNLPKGGKETARK